MHKRSIINVAILFFIALPFVACGTSADGGFGESAMDKSSGGSSGGAVHSSAMDAGTTGGSSSGGSSSAASTSGGSSSSSQGGAKAGVLTAGDWGDNLNWGWFQKYLGKALKQNKGFPQLGAGEQVLVHVHDQKLTPQKGAKIEFLVDGKTIHETTAASDGRAVLLPVRDAAGVTPTTVRVTPVGGNPETFPGQSGTDWSFHTKAAAPTKKSLDVAFIVDTTGSMADEMAWLKKEIAALADNVVKAHPDVDVRWGIVLYRDHGPEAYLTKIHPFTNSAVTLKNKIKSEKPGGGGDFPEALDKGIEEATKLKWRGGATTKVAFFIADAPAHQKDEKAALAGVETLRKAGVRIYPLAASGAHGRTELFMRVAAMLTGGRYLFLTDHSGVGNPHAEPHIPCYLVQHLTKLVARVIASELQGAWALPAKDDIITTVGKPKAGVCTYDSGAEFFIM